MCVYIPESAHLMEGWGCCKCKTYNGMRRLVCKYCGNVPCDIQTQKDHQEQCQEDNEATGRGLR